MKGIYKIIFTNSGKEIGIYATDDLERAEMDFREGVMPSKGARRIYEKGIELSLVILEVTDDLNERLAAYVLPQLQRVEYSTVCIDKIEKKGYVKKINAIVDWLVSTFPEQEYSFVINENQDEVVIGSVMKDGTLIEVYAFEKNSGEPTSRA